MTNPSEADDHIFLVPTSARTIREGFGMTYHINIKNMLNDLSPEDARKVAELSAAHVSENA